MKIVGGSACCVAALLVTTGAFAQAPNKPIQACADEYGARAAELKADNISAPEFYHECWWHTAGGHATDLSDVHKRRAVLADHSRTKQVVRGKPVETTRVEVRAVKEARSQRTQAHGVTREARASKAAGSNKAAQSVSASPRVALASRSSRAKQALVEARAAGQTHAGREARYAADRRSAREQRVAFLVRRRKAASEASRVAALKRREQTRLANTEGDHISRTSLFRKRQVADRSRAVAAGRNSRIAATERSPDRDVQRQDRQAIPAGLPQGTRLGEQAWIASAGTRPHLAVIVGHLSQDATKGSSLHCWGQQVLYSQGSRWGEATVCDGSAVAGAPNTWFVGYDRVPRVERRSEKPGA